MRKKAFTLIELLVVIAIIALLLSIIVPAIRKAKEVVKRVICSSDIRQIGIALQTYGNSFNGKMLPMTHIVNNAVCCYSDNLASGHTVSATGPIQPWMGVITQIILTGTPVPEGVLATSKPKALNLGVLHDLNFFGAAEAFYCPAQPLNSEGPIPFSYDRYTNKGGYQWGMFTPTPAGASNVPAVRTSYNYWVGRTRVGNAYNVRFSELSANKVLVVDNLQDWYVVPHRVNSASSVPQGVSMLYADNHAEFCMNKNAFDKGATYNNTRIWGADTPLNYSDGPGNNNTWFESLLTWIPQRQ